MIGVGIDILDLKKFKKVIKRYRERFLKRIFTEKEIEKIPKKDIFYAVNFSFKESIWKSLPERMQKNTFFKDIEILWENGTPSVRIKKKQYPISLSFSFSEDFVITVSIF
ncbi:MAG: hypothetical protein DRP67_00700 [Candidatus Omnitrophota bacterium]|nr:MAG: hypothetical protein DRP67_00700 [Candidatus Omnitrophota bacterium]